MCTARRMKRERRQPKGVASRCRQIGTAARRGTTNPIDERGASSRTKLQEAVAQVPPPNFFFKDAQYTFGSFTRVGHHIGWQTPLIHKRRGPKRSAPLIEVSKQNEGRVGKLSTRPEMNGGKGRAILTSTNMHQRRWYTFWAGRDTTIQQRLSIVFFLEQRDARGRLLTFTIPPALLSVTVLSCGGSYAFARSLDRSLVLLDHALRENLIEWQKTKDKKIGTSSGFFTRHAN